MSGKIAASSRDGTTIATDGHARGAATAAFGRRMSVLQKPPRATARTAHPHSGSRAMIRAVIHTFPILRFVTVAREILDRTRLINAPTWQFAGSARTLGRAPTPGRAYCRYAQHGAVVRFCVNITEP